MRKMEHIQRSAWSAWSHGNDATGRSAEPLRAPVGDPEAVLRRTDALVHLKENENDFDPFLHLKCAK